MCKIRSVLILILFLNQVFAETEAPVVSQTSLNISKVIAVNNSFEDGVQQDSEEEEESDTDSNKETTSEISADQLLKDEDPPHSDHEADLYDDEEEEEHLKPFGRDLVQKPRALVIRCSRRFTPGSCIQSLTTVWTYSFDQQNCTERLGCPPQTFRTNRFKSFNRCTRMCTPLSNIYTLILNLDDRELTEQDSTRRRLSESFKENKDAPTLPPLSDSYSDSEGRPIAHEYYDSLDREMASDDEYHPVPIDEEEFEVDSGLLEDFHSNFNF